MFAQTIAMSVDCKYTRSRVHKLLFTTVHVKDTAAWLRMSPVPSQTTGFLLDSACSDLSCLLLAGCPLIKPVELCFTLLSL